MRIAHMAAILLLLPASAGAQTTRPEVQTPAPPAQPTAPAEPAAPAWTGWIDFGLRGTNVDGDAARFERYRDLGDGLFLESFRVGRDARRWLIDFDGQHAGRRDQRLSGTAVAVGRLKASVVWDQIPMLLSRTTRSLVSGIGTGELLLDDALQAQVQATRGRLPWCSRRTHASSRRKHAGTSPTALPNISPARR